MTHDELLARAADAVAKGECPVDLGVYLDADGWCRLYRMRYWLNADGVVRVETAWAD